MMTSPALQMAVTVLACVMLTHSAAAQQPARQTGDHVIHRFERQQLSDVYFSEGATAGDLNSDGVVDVVCGPWWYAGPDFQTRHEIYPAVPQDRKGYADNFFSWVFDADGNGDNDILTVGFPGKPAFLYRNPGKANVGDLWEKFQVVDSVSNESPQFTDLTGDGRPELVCTRHGHYGFARFDPSRAFEQWTFVSISGDVAPKPFGHGLGVGDVNGDGRQDVIARDGWFAQPENVVDNDPWPFHKFDFAPAAADMFAYDVDGDGDNDIITSLSAHNYGLAWYENLPGENGIPTFKQHLIMGTLKSDSPYGVLFTEPHAVQLADINGDGLKDIVTGKTYWSHHTQSPMWDAGAVVYWFELQRSATGEVDYVPRKADGEAGVGRGLFVGDITGDGLPDIVAGGMKGCHVLKHEKVAVSHAEWRLHQPSKRLPMAEGLSPQAAAAQMTVPPGFQVQLAAGEPLVHQPIAMCFDHRGRLWVAEGHTYPLRAAEGEGKDRIVIFEDTTGDGLFDKSTTFIEGLNLVSGLEVGFGGVYVGAAPYLMFIPDRDGDDHPDTTPFLNSSEDNRFSSLQTTDRSELQFPGDVPAGAIVLRDGFGWHDTHETLNAFIWGPDGWLYGCHGVFTHSKVGKPGTQDDQRQGLNCGVWRYHPIKDLFEVFAHGTSNPWGVDFNDHGQAFISACVIPHLWHMVQGGRYHRQGGQHFNSHTYDDIKTIADHAHYVGNIRDHAWWGHEPKAAGGTDDAGGGHAHAGAMIYRGDNWPDRYRNQMFFNNIHGNRVNCESLEKIPNRSGFVGRHEDDFLFANDHYYRGINLRYGPDGSVYVIDWYDRNACHRTNPEIWDRSNGRIYRVSYGDCAAVKVDLESMSSLELVGLLAHRNNWYVTMARRILQHRGPSAEVEEAIMDLIARHTQLSGETANVPLYLNALWALHAIGGVDRDADSSLTGMFQHPQEYIAAWSIQLELEDRQISPENLQELIAVAADTKSAVVRMYLASGLQRLPLEQRWKLAEALCQREEDADDHNIPLLLWYGIEPLVPEDTQRAMQLAASARIPILQRYIVRRASAGNDTINQVVAALRATQQPAVQRLIMDEMLAAFEGRVDIPMPAAWEAAYESLTASEEQVIRDRANQLAVLFGDQRVFAGMRSLLADATQDIQRRRQALDVLVRGQDKASVDVLLSDSVLTNKQLQGPAIRALTAVGQDSTPAVLLGHYKTFDEARQQDVINTLISRPTWTASLLQAIGTQTVPASDLSAYHVRQILSFNNDRLKQQLEQHWGRVTETSEDRLQQIERWKKKLTPAELSKAHRGNGRRVFSKTCQNCHRLFGIGGDIGPDITGSNRANLDYILENLLDPSSVVGRNYQMTVLALKSGQLVSGLLKQETDSALTIQTINDRVVVPLNQIEERTLSHVSMMPERQLNALSADDARDLIAYLSSPQQVALTGPPSEIDARSGKVPGALEAESMKVVEKSGGSVRNQPMSNFKTDRWSGNDQLWWTGGKPGDRLALELPVETAGTFTVQAVFTKARDYGTVKLSIDDQLLDPELDFFHQQGVITTGVLSYPNVTLTAGLHRLQMEVTGANPDAVKGYMVGIDYVRLIPTQDQVK